MNKECMYSVGQLSQISNLSVKQLHYLDKKNILSPSIRDENNNYRYYSKAQLEKVLFIQNIKKLGFSFNDIVKILEDNTFTNMLRSVGDNVKSINMEIEALSTLAKENIAFYQRLVECLYLKIENKSNAYRVIELPPCKVISIRETEKSSVESMFVEREMILLKKAEAEGIPIVGDFSAIFHSGYASQFRDEYGDLETYYKVDEDFSEYDKVKVLPAIKGIRGVHSGRYTEMKDLYLSMEKWAEKENLVTTGKSIEMYKIGPHMVPHDADYLTIIILEIL